MIELERLSPTGEVMFKKGYASNMADQLLSPTHVNYPNGVTRWRVAEVEAPKRRKKKENEED